MFGRKKTQIDSAAYLLAMKQEGKFSESDHIRKAREKAKTEVARLIEAKLAKRRKRKVVVPLKGVVSG